MNGTGELVERKLGDPIPMLVEKTVKLPNGRTYVDKVRKMGRIVAIGPDMGYLPGGGGLKTFTIEPEETNG